MKKIMSLMLGLALVTGVVAFGQEKDTTKSTTKKKKASKKELGQNDHVQLQQVRLAKIVCSNRAWVPSRVSMRDCLFRGAFRSAASATGLPLASRCCWF